MRFVTITSAFRHLHLGYNVHSVLCSSLKCSESVAVPVHVMKYSIISFPSTAAVFRSVKHK